jgi:hypothetical protein
MHYYPCILPYINTDKLKAKKNVKCHKSETTMLYSSEGMFQIRKGQLYQVHFQDDEHSEKRKINGVDYVCDNSNIVWSSCNKLPYDFERRDITELCFERGSVKFYVNECKGKIIHCFFSIKSQNILDIEQDIAELMACAKA